MSAFVVDGILYEDPESIESEPEKPADEFRSTGEASVPVVVAEILSLAPASYLATVADQVRSTLPALVDRVALLPSLPMLVWHTVRYCLEPGERDGGT